MKRRPKGKRYSGLTARGSIIYCSVVVDGKRHRFSCQTDDWDVGAATRDAYLAEIGRPGFHSTTVAIPTLAEFAERYLEEGISRLAASTANDRAIYLDPEGRLLARLGHLPLDAITAADLHRWWAAEIDNPKGEGGEALPPLSLQTGRHHINVLASVLKYAKALNLIESSPVEAFREQIADMGRGKQGRAQTAPKATPIERPEDVARLVEAAEAEGLVPLAYVLCHLDAGLRNGEVLGLRFGDIADRELLIRQARSRGGVAEAPKNGRSRNVALSARLRGVLERVSRERFEPGPDALVFEGIDPANFRKREWRRILKRAGIGHRRIKDLRDTFASQLLTDGVSPAWISKQLGHSDWAVTAKHYAQWIDAADYRAPVALADGEVPPDLLARSQPERAATSSRSPSGLTPV